MQEQQLELLQTRQKLGQRLVQQKRQQQVQMQQVRVLQLVQEQPQALEFQQACHKQPKRRQRRQLPGREICSF